MPTIVSLRFPHIRLEIYNLLLSTGDCVSALEQFAEKYGLGCPADLSEIRRQVQNGACGSMSMAKAILRETAPLLADELIEQLIAKVEQYKKDHNKPHCRGVKLAPHALDCGGMAPVVMDYLLQLLDVHLDLEAETND